jgi:hypothetical protein
LSSVGSSLIWIAAAVVEVSETRPLRAEPLIVPGEESAQGYSLAGHYVSGFG